MKTTLKTEAGLLQLRTAAADDENIVLLLVQKLALWLREKGMDQWSYYETSPGENMIRRRIRAGNTYLAFLEEELVATVSVLWEDPEVWGDKGSDGLAGYVHSMAVDRRYGNLGVGREMLQWALGMIAQAGKVSRLDCMSTNEFLNNYYQKSGFLPAGEKVFPTGYRVNLYERK